MSDGFLRRVDGIATLLSTSNSIKMYIFWWDMFFSNSINITFTWCINLFIWITYLFFFFFFRPFYLSTWFLCFLSLESSVTFHLVSMFTAFVLFWMLSMLVIMNKLKHIKCHGPHTSHITTTGIFAAEFFFSLSNDKSLILVTQMLTNNLQKHK